MSKSVIDNVRHLSGQIWPNEAAENFAGKLRAAGIFWESGRLGRTGWWEKYRVDVGQENQRTIEGEDMPDSSSIRSLILHLHFHSFYFSPAYPAHQSVALDSGAAQGRLSLLSHSPPSLSHIAKIPHTDLPWSKLPPPNLILLFSRQWDCYSTPRPIIPKFSVVCASTYTQSKLGILGGNYIVVSVLYTVLSNRPHGAWWHRAC